MSIMWLSKVVLCNINDPCKSRSYSDNDVLQFSRNIQFLNAEFFHCGATGESIDAYDPSLAAGGPPPLGCQRANLDPMSRRMVEEFALEEVGNLRVLAKFIEGPVIPRPLLDLTKETIGRLIGKAFDPPLSPPFDPYRNPLHYFILCNFITYTGLTGLVASAPTFISREDRTVVARFEAMEAGQNAICRQYLYQRSNDRVLPYQITVAEFTNHTSELANRLGRCGMKDEGVIVPRLLGAENRTESNILAADSNSLTYTRTIPELMRILQGNENESEPGGFFPKGANGDIGRSLRKK
ncbi:desiccation-related protein PCC13-62-like [Cucumis melo var. makuwa]|nr:desiccation-related protein PCC13-62-like [Cucumis melo var. makuwa]TYK18112.1 desiccation-related protein PCC13-62-like [Cucumis melo var. makuwa]